MDESMRIAVVGIAAPAAIGLLAGVGAAVIKNVGRADRDAAAERRATQGIRPHAERGGTQDEGFVGARVLVVVGVTLGMFVAFFGVHGKGVWPPVGMDDRMFLLPPALGLIGLAGVVVTAWRGRRSVGGEKRLGWIVSCACAGMGGAIATAIVLGPPLWNGTLEGTGEYLGVVWVQVVFGVWAALSAWAIGRIARSGARVSAAAVMVGLSAAVGAALLGTPSVVLGNYGFGVAATCAGLVAGVLVMRGSLGPGAIAAVCAMLGALLSCGRFFTDPGMPWWVIGGLACAAPAALAADVLIARKMGPLGGAIVRIGVAAVVAGAVVAPGVISLVTFVRGAE